MDYLEVCVFPLQEVRRTLAEEVVAASPPDLNTIDEHEETKEFTPKQLVRRNQYYDCKG